MYTGCFQLQVKGLLTWVWKDKQIYRHTYKHTYTFHKTISGNQAAWLNPEMIGAIKVATFRMWPLESTETDEIAWRKCRKAIDLARRQLTRKLPKLDGKEN